VIAASTCCGSGNCPKCARSLTHRNLLLRPLLLLLPPLEPLLLLCWNGNLRDFLRTPQLFSDNKA
jgi:hypothetical protein